MADAELFPLDDLSERPLRFGEQPLSAGKLVLAELCRLNKVHQDSVDTLIVALAQACFQTEHVRVELAAAGQEAAENAAAALEIIVANLRDCLAAHDARCEDYTGLAWTPDLRRTVELRGHRTRAELTEPRVAHMEAPVIYRGSRLLAKGAAAIETPPRDS